MGRRKDDFLWSQVERAGARWVCKHCHEEFAGSATRVRNHLSGAGNDISACRVVPSHIRDEALKKNTRERRPSSSVSPLRIPSSSTAAAPPPQHDPSPSSSNDPDSITKSAAEDYVRAAFMKMMMAIGVFDAIDHPTVREFWKGAHQHGVPLSLRGGSPSVIDKPLSNIKQEVYQYMLMVKESWKTTGCTMIIYNLSEKKENFANGRRMDVIGLYCPKGFIFVRVPSLVHWWDGKILDYRLAHPDDKIVHLIHHQYHLTPQRKKPGASFKKINHRSKSDAPLCETSEHMGSRIFESYVDCGCTTDTCLLLQIRVACLEQCDESEWANGLIDQAVQLHNLLLEAKRSSVYQWYCTILAAKDEKMLDSVDEKTKIQEVHLSIFLLIMRLAADMQLFYEGERYFHCEREGFLPYDHPKIMAILGEPKFWIEGRKLALVLTLMWRISDIMDTLVPTANYLGMALHNVESVLLEVNKSSSYGITEADEAFHFWTCLRNIFNLYEENLLRYLDPRYFLQQNVNVTVKKELEIKLSCNVDDDEEEESQLRKDLECYCDVFRRFSEKIQLSNFHPIKLWEQYGHDLPVLQKYAIKLFSQPLTCMCNQVRKHIYQLQGRDDYILSLNVKMMEEFKILGDDIYNYPIDINPWQWIPAGLRTSEPKYA